jgi:hypothetical protein
VAQYKCTNFGICSEFADTGKIIESTEFEPRCPECKSLLSKYDPPKNHKWLKIVAGMTLVVGIAIIIYWLWPYSVVITPPNAEQGKIISQDFEKTLDCGSNCEHFYSKGTRLTLRAQPMSGFEFIEWSGACASSKTSDCVLTIDEDKKVGVRFDKLPELPTLKITSPDSKLGKIIAANSATGNIDCGTTCSQEYAKGTEIKLIAIPAQNVEFQAWTDDCEGVKTNECNLKMDGNKNVGVIFKPIDNKVMLRVFPSGEGVVKSENGEIYCFKAKEDEKNQKPNCKVKYAKDTKIVLTATPKEGHQVRQWMEACEQAENNQCTVVLDTDKDAMIVFEKTPISGEKPGADVDKIDLLEPIINDCSNLSEKDCVSAIIATPLK